MPVPLPDLVVALVVTFLASAVQGSIGIGFNIVSVPVLSLVNPLLAPVPQMFLNLGITSFMAVRERAHIDVRGVSWILAGRAGGALIGLGLLKTASGAGLDVIVASMVLAAVAVIGSGWQVRRTRHTEVVAGVASGTGSIVSSIGGPPIALLYRDATGPTIRSSLATVFLIGSTISLLGRFTTGEMVSSDATIALWLAPAALAGVLASTLLTKWAEGPVIKRAILIVSVMAAAGLLIRAAL